MKKFLSLLSLLFIAGALSAQCAEQSQLWLIFFKDKPKAYIESEDLDALGFAQKAIDRRCKVGLAFPMEEDFPVNAAYIKSVAPMVQCLRHPLRWFNALTVEATERQIQAVKALPFVLDVQPFEELVAATAAVDETWATTKDGDSLEYTRLFGLQREMVGMEVAEKAGLSGKGILVAVFDAGFTGADSHEAFAHLRENGQIKATQDFVGGGQDVYRGSGHGTAVLSCIGGMYKGQRMGAAMDANFILARTEYNSKEVIAEEDHWLAAMEWADRQGADIISSSLGYSKPRYVYADMDGHKTLVTRAAAMAMRKGIMVVNSAGNEGAGKFHYITAPSDADSVLTVAGAYPMLCFKMPFSSLGPNARGVLKPEIAAPGYVLAANKRGGYSPIGGTSFACPLMAGLTACLMQKHPEATNMAIKRMIVEAGHSFPYYDYALGYGVFNMGRALNPPAPTAQTFTVQLKGDTTWFDLDPEVVNRDTLNNKNGKPFSYRFVLPDGKLSSYRTVLIRKSYRFGIPPQQRTAGKLEAWFEGYIWREE